MPHTHAYTPPMSSDTHAHEFYFNKQPVEMRFFSWLKRFSQILHI